MPDLDVSVVVPVLDESESVRELARSIRGVLSEAGLSFELLFVDDGSTDGTGRLLDEISREHADTSVVRLRRNFGKAAALNEGFRRLRGGYVAQDVPLEALQARHERGVGASTTTTRA